MYEKLLANLEIKRWKLVAEHLKAIRVSRDLTQLSWRWTNCSLSPISRRMLAKVAMRLWRTARPNPRPSPYSIPMIISKLELLLERQERLRSKPMYSTSDPKLRQIRKKIWSKQTTKVMAGYRRESHINKISCDRSKLRRYVGLLTSESTWSTRNQKFCMLTMKWIYENLLKAKLCIGKNGWVRDLITEAKDGKDQIQACTQR